MKPVVIIVGRTNVGKSTLFNALTRSRAALVADFEGLTRDRQYGHGVIGDRPYLLVDTGGWLDDSDPLGARMRDQINRAIEEADAIMFVVDGRAGPNAADRALADVLRRAARPLTLVVNKTEGLDGEMASAEFHALALGEPVAISAAHAQGLAGLMDQVLAPLPVVAESPPETDVPRITVAGRPNVGKSTLVNRLLGEDRMIVFDAPGTTRDAIRIPIERAGRRYELVDTAGVRRKSRVGETLEKFSVIKSLQAIDDSNVVILVLDAQSGISEQDVHLAGYIAEQGRAMVLAVNKWDAPDSGEREWLKRELDRKLPFLEFLNPHFISALTGAGVNALWPAVDRAYASARREFGTGLLNRILGRAVQATPPPMGRGARIRLKYAHQGGRNPPRIIVHGNQVNAVPEFYRRFLANTFRKALKLEGTPVVIEFASGSNPYDKPSSKKTPQRKRKPKPAVRRSRS